MDNSFFNKSFASDLQSFSDLSSSDQKSSILPSYIHDQNYYHDQEVVGSGEEEEEEIQEDIDEEDSDLEEEEEEEEDSPFLRNMDCVNNFKKLSYRKKIRGMSLFSSLSVFTYLFIAPSFWWIIFTALPSLYIFFIIPRNIDSYLNYEKKYQIIYYFDKIVKKKIISYYQRWLLLNALFRTALIFIIIISYKYNIFSLQTLYLIQMVIYPIINSYYTYSFGVQYNRNIFL